MATAGNATAPGLFMYQCSIGLLDKANNTPLT